MSATLAARTAASSRSTLRSLLRHVRTRFDVDHPAHPLPTRRCPWSVELLSRYRASAHLPRGPASRALRSQASETLEYLVCVADQAELVSRYRGVDADAPTSRAAAARFVGLAMPPTPKSTDEVRSEAEVVGPYAEALARSGGGDYSRLTGVDNLKHQLYGPKTTKRTG